MTDETIKNFLEYVLRSMTIMEDGIKLLLHNYQTVIEEQQHPFADCISVEQIRTLLLSKVRDGKSAEIKELLNLFEVEKLSDLNEENYQELYDMAQKI